MFTIPSSRKIDTHLKYTVKVINVTAVNCLQNAITYSQVNHLDECVAAIEEYRERYLSKNNDYALFVEITTTIAYQDVRLEAFWVDD